MSVFEIEYNGETFEVDAPNQDAALFALYSAYHSDKPIAQFAKSLGLDQKGTLGVLKYASERGKSVGFESKPTTGGDVMSTARSALQGMTFGFGDEIVAGGTALGRKVLQGDERAMGDIYEQELQRERERIGQFRQESPYLAYGTEIASGAAVPIGAAGTMKQALGLGAGVGAVSAAGTSEGDVMDRLIAMPVGAAMGAILGGAVQGLGNTVSAQFKSYMTKKAQKAAAMGAKSVQELKDEAQAAYQAARQSGVGISPEAFKQVIMDTIDEAASGRPISSRLTPKSAAVIDDITDEIASIMKVEGKALGFEDVEYFRQIAQIPAKDFSNPAEQRIAGILQKNIDNFMDGVSEGRFFGGDAEAAVSALKKARSTWARMRKTEKVQDILDKATTYAGGLESGLRNQISNLLRNKKARAQFSKDEIALLAQIREGTPIGNLIGNMSQAGYSLTGGRNVFGGGLAGATGVVAGGAGLAVGGPLGAGIGILTEQAATTGVKYVREMALQKRVELFRDIVANGLASQVKTANPSAFRMLEKAFNAAQSGVIKGATAGADEPTSRTIDLMTQ